MSGRLACIACRGRCFRRCARAGPKHPPQHSSGRRGRGPAIFPYASSQQAFQRLSAALAAETRGSSVRVLIGCPHSDHIAQVLPDRNAGLGGRDERHDPLCQRRSAAGLAAYIADLLDGECSSRDAPPDQPLLDGARQQLSRGKQQDLPMTQFNDRERAFEAKFARDEEMQFRILARRNRLLGRMGGAADGLVRGRNRGLRQGRRARRLRGSRGRGRHPQGAGRPDRCRASIATMAGSAKRSA